MNTHTDNPETDDIHNASISALKKEGMKRRPLGPEDPKVPFPVPGLPLSRKQEDALVSLCKQWMGDLDTEMGRSETDTSTAQFGEEWFAARAEGESDPATNRPLQQSCNTFFGKRAIYELIWQNKMAWRRSVIGGVFDKVNLTLSTARRIASQRVARFNRYFFESRPWWNAEPQRRGVSKDFARSLVKWADWKLYESGTVAELSMSVVRAAVVGEGILKTTRAMDDDMYREEMEVCIDSNGQPIVASDGDYLFRDDLWMLAPLDPIAAAVAAEAEANGMPFAPVQMIELLERDQLTRRDGNMIYVTQGDAVTEFLHSTYEVRMLDRRTVHYQGARTELVYYRDFLCPLGAKNIHTAPCIVHLYDIDASELAQAYAADATEDTIRQAVEMIENAVTGQDGDGADVSRPRVSIGESSDTRTVSDGTPKLQVGEFYLRCDPDGTGITRDVMVVMDIKTWTPVYYNFTAIASPTRRRPFRVVREFPVEGRWYGQGTIERFYDLNNLIDLHLDRAVLNQSRSGRIDFFAAHNTMEGIQDPSLRVSWGGAYTARAGVDPSKIIYSHYLQDNKSGELMSVLQLFQQAATNESGTANTNDAAAAGLDTQETATGINNIVSAGNELTALPIFFLRVGLTEALHDFVATTFRFHDETETYMYFDGETPVELTIPNRDVRNLSINVSITLTSMQSERDLPKKRAAIADANDYYDRAGMDPFRAQRLAPLYQDVLQNEGVENAQTVIVPPPVMATVPEMGTTTSSTSGV